ncbi:MAG: lysoplasmalogenase [Pseudomonadota bacterium]
MKTAILAMATAASALLAMLAGPHAIGQPWLAFMFKPLTTLLVIAYAWGRGAQTPAVRRWVLVGLWLSLAGDVALLWPQQGFLPGLVSFLLAHLAYLVAFTRDTRLAARPLPFAAYALLAAGILAWLWPGVPAPLKLPVMAYVVFLASMAAQAASRWMAHRETAGLQLGALGGLLFMCSDALLAADRFHAPLPAAAVWILSTYWLAQWCIASSLHGKTAHRAAGA